MRWRDTGRAGTGITGETVAKQVKVALHGLTADQVKNIVIAYEPVWAIGTGKTATAEQAEEVCAFIRATVADLYDKAIADGMTIQYGGSMNEKNCAELLAKEDIDGGLIGGASLVAEKFGVCWQKLPSKKENCRTDDSLKTRERKITNE